MPALSLYAGDSAEARVKGVLASSVADGVYTKLVDAGALFRELHFERELDGSYGGYLVTESTLSVGHNTGKIEIHLCRDANCAAEFAGSPVAVPYDVEVLKSQNLTPLSAWSGVAGWSTYRGNNAQTGYVPVTLDAGKFSQRWRWSPEIPSGKLGLTMVATADGKLYASAANKPYALKEHDASVVWSHDLQRLGISVGRRSGRVRR